MRRETNMVTFTPPQLVDAAVSDMHAFYDTIKRTRDVNHTEGGAGVVAYIRSMARVERALANNEQFKRALRAKY